MKQKFIFFILLFYFTHIVINLKVQVNDRDTREGIVENKNRLVFLHFSKKFTENLKNYIGDNRRDYDLESSMFVNIDKNSMYNFLKI